MTPRINFLFQDITKAETDAIVNATDCRLSGGGGVDKAIHMAAGATSMRCSLEGKSLKTGEALTTPGFALPAKYVIHTVGPRYSMGQSRAKAYLQSAYSSRDRLAGTPH
jgi:O-acetyl-ADP-ribose deacetylase (regulator of RNase III)